MIASSPRGTGRPLPSELWGPRQVEERLRFYEEGIAPKKNITAMQEVIAKLPKKDEAEEDEAKPDKSEKKKKKKKKAEAEETAQEEVM